MASCLVFDHPSDEDIHLRSSYFYTCCKEQASPCIISLLFSPTEQSDDGFQHRSLSRVCLSYPAGRCLFQMHPLVSSMSSFSFGASVAILLTPVSLIYHRHICLIADCILAGPIAPANTNITTITTHIFELALRHQHRLTT